jgi:fumarate hydratase class I
VTADSLAADEAAGKEVVKVDMNQPMSEMLAMLDQYPIKTRLSLSGTLVVARDIAHAKIKERLDAGGKHAPPFD